MKNDYNAQYWKSKAVRRNAEIKAAKKRNKEIMEGREKWKQKYKDMAELAKTYEKELASIKKKLEKILTK